MHFPGGGAAAEALQSCPILCDPIDGSPAGSPSLGFSSKNTGAGAIAFSSRVALVAKNLQQYERRRLDPWVRRSPGGGHGSPPRCSCLENPLDRGAGGFQSTGSQRVGHG